MDPVVVWAVGICLFAGCVILYLALRRTTRQTARDAAERSTYRDLVEHGNDAILVIDLADGRILLANGKAAELLGYSKEALAKRTIFDLHDRADLQRSATRMADAWQQGGLVYEDIPFVTADGTSLPVECSTKVMRYGVRSAILLHARDIRERLALQRRLAAEQAAVKERDERLQASLHYAHRIQTALLPAGDRPSTVFAESFIISRPKDIVSGDFHWFAQVGDTSIVVAADCTGHGVPGALLSMIGITLFQEAVLTEGITDPGKILDRVRQGVIHKLNGNGTEATTQDGTNAAVICVDSRTSELSYAGGFAPLFLVREGTLVQYKGDRMPIGPQERGTRPFNTECFTLLSGDRLFIGSDGYQDQFGGPQGRKLMSSRLMNWLVETSTLPMDVQSRALQDRFNQWKGLLDQVDDVLLIGLQR